MEPGRNMATVTIHGNERRVLGALLLTIAFMVAELVGGLLAGSLALLADAGHMITDAGALFLAWHAFRVEPPAGNAGPLLRP